MQSTKNYFCRIIKSVFQKYFNDSTDEAWIDLKWCNDSNIWTWSSGDLLEDNSLLWSPGEPNGENRNQNCATIYRSNGRLNDAPCDWTYKALCEIPLQ